MSLRRDLKNEGTRCVGNYSIKAIEGEGNERKFELSWASEEPYERFFGTEILEVSEDTVDLTRLNSIGVLLYNHKRDVVIGKIEKAWVDNRRCYATVEFDKDEESEKIYQKVKSGTLKGVSVGYRVNTWEEVAANKKSSDGRFTGPCFIAKSWEAFEISIVSVPADPTVGVGRSQQETEASMDLYKKQLQINKNYI